MTKLAVFFVPCGYFGGKRREDRHFSSYDSDREKRYLVRSHFYCRGMSPAFLPYQAVMRPYYHCAVRNSPALNSTLMCHDTGVTRSLAERGLILIGFCQWSVLLDKWRENKHFRVYLHAVWDADVYLLGLGNGKTKCQFLLLLFTILLIWSHQ